LTELRAQSAVTVPVGYCAKPYSSVARLKLTSLMVWGEHTSHHPLCMAVTFNGHYATQKNICYFLNRPMFTFTTSDNKGNN